MRDIQAEAGSLANFFGGEEGRKNMGQIFGGNTISTVGHMDMDRLQVFFLNVHGEGSAGRHGLNGINNDVQQDLFEGIDAKESEVGIRRAELKFNILCRQLLSDQRNRAFY